MARAPFTLSKHPAAITTVLADALEAARTQGVIELRPPGHISLEPRQRGGRYAYWSRLADGKLAREYIGPEGGDGHLAALAELDQLKRFQLIAKNLRKLGFVSVEHEAALVLAQFHNAGLFAGGGVLVGTRAFGVLLNQLGWRATPFLATQDVDIARPTKLTLAGPMADKGFADILARTGMRFVPVMGLERPPAPPTSYKVVGRDLKVDLLVPSRLKSKPYACVPVAELAAHATALPFLEFLLKDTWLAVAIGRDHLVPVRVPEPARYALHKLVVADVRSGVDNPKIEKDLLQAAILAVILLHDEPTALPEAAAELTPSMRKHARKSLSRLRAVAGDEYAAEAQAMETLLVG